jgi:hypothetical protein
MSLRHLSEKLEALRSLILTRPAFVSKAGDRPEILIANQPGHIKKPDATQLDGVRLDNQLPKHASSGAFFV